MVKSPPNNLWIIAAVLAPIAVVTLIIIIITAVLCRKNKNDFKADAIGNLNPRAKVFIFPPMQVFFLFCFVYVRYWLLLMPCDIAFLVFVCVCVHSCTLAAII